MTTIGRSDYSIISPFLYQSVNRNPFANTPRLDEAIQEDLQNEVGNMAAIQSRKKEYEAFLIFNRNSATPKIERILIDRTGKNVTPDPISTDYLACIKAPWYSGFDLILGSNYIYNTDRSLQHSPGVFTGVNYTQRFNANWLVDSGAGINAASRLGKFDEDNSSVLNYTDYSLWTRGAYQNKYIISSLSLGYGYTTNKVENFSAQTMPNQLDILLNPYHLMFRNSWLSNVQINAGIKNTPYYHSINDGENTMHINRGLLYGGINYRINNNWTILTNLGWASYILTGNRSLFSPQTFGIADSTDSYGYLSKLEGFLGFRYRSDDDSTITVRLNGGYGKFNANTEGSDYNVGGNIEYEFDTSFPRFGKIALEAGYNYESWNSVAAIKGNNHQVNIGFKWKVNLTSN